MRKPPVKTSRQCHYIPDSFAGRSSRATYRFGCIHARDPRRFLAAVAAAVDARFQLGREGFQDRGRVLAAGHLFDHLRVPARVQVGFGAFPCDIYIIPSQGLGFIVEWLGDVAEEVDQELERFLSVFRRVTTIVYPLRLHKTSRRQSNITKQEWGVFFFGSTTYIVGNRSDHAASRTTVSSSVNAAGSWGVIFGVNEVVRGAEFASGRAPVLVCPACDRGHCPATAQETRHIGLGLGCKVMVCDRRHCRMPKDTPSMSAGSSAQKSNSSIRKSQHGEISKVAKRDFQGEEAQLCK